jgi:hypothetical protein
MISKTQLERKEGFPGKRRLVFALLLHPAPFQGTVFSSLEGRFANSLRSRKKYAHLCFGAGD